ncbi:MAG: CoA transferase [Chloroflexi bacterium]|nr:CoA transferase [Chloroflexota bacterium]
MPGPLSGRRFIDFTWAWAGPYGALQLALLGAEVIKVESTTRMDHSRLRSLAAGQFKGGHNQAPMFNELNLNKRSITLNLKTPEAQRIVKQLAERSDGAIDNFRPGTLDKLGLGYDDLNAVRPEFVMVSSSAVGAAGPERNYVGYAPTFAALAGLSYLTGNPDGPPAQMGGSIDLRAGTAAALAMVAAVLHRDRTGKGQFVDASAREAIAMHMGEQFLAVSMTGEDATRRGNDHSSHAPHGVYPCTDGDRKQWVAIECRSDAEWEAFCHTARLPHLLSDDRFRTGLRRWRNRDALNALIEDWTKPSTAREIADLLLEAGVPASPTLSGKALYEDPHFQARLNAIPVTPPEMDERLVLAPPWRLSLTPAEIRSPAPLLGEHTRWVLDTLLDYDAETIDQLEEAGVLA